MIDNYLDESGQPLQGTRAVSAENAFRRSVGLVPYSADRVVIERLERRNVERFLLERKLRLEKETASDSVG